MSIEKPLSFDAIIAAAETLKGIARETPLLESALLNEQLGRRLLVKPECLQLTGSFKFRGAYNTLAGLPAAQRAQGVVAFSSGNHAQGVALAARMFDVPAVIIMPADAPRLKIDNTRSYGADVILYDRNTEDREAICRDLSESQGLTLVKPYDQVSVIAGQGTVGLEISQQCHAIGVTPNAVFVPCGGGGLTSGVATALSTASPETQVVGVEPSDFDDTVRSLDAGERLGVAAGGASACDALLSPMPGEITFPILQARDVRATSVTDDQAFQAMQVAYESLKLVAEPGGAVALAAALAPTFADYAGIDPTSTVVAVISGGNVDADMFARALLRAKQDG